MSRPALEPWPLAEQTARGLGLPQVAATPTAPLVAHRTEWLGFDPAERLALGRGRTRNTAFRRRRWRMPWRAFDAGR